MDFSWYTVAITYPMTSTVYLESKPRMLRLSSIFWCECYFKPIFYIFYIHYLYFIYFKLAQLKRCLLHIPSTVGTFGHLMQFTQFFPSTYVAPFYTRYNCFLLLYHTQIIFQAGNIHESAFNFKEKKIGTMGSGILLRCAMHHGPNKVFVCKTLNMAS